MNIKKYSIRIALLSLLLVVLFGAGAKAQDDDLDYYINASGQKIAGVITLDYFNDFISYRPNSETRKYTKIPINDIKMVVVNQHTKKESYVDTLYVVADGTRKDQKKYFGKLALTSPTMHVYFKFKDIPQGMTFNMSSTSPAALSANRPVGQWEMGHGGSENQRRCTRKMAATLRTN